MEHVYLLVRTEDSDVEYLGAFTDFDSAKEYKDEFIREVYCLDEDENIDELEFVDESYEILQVEMK